MPWSNNNGGWKGGGGGPWGSGPQQGGPNPPDLEDILKKSQDRLKTVIPGGGGSLGLKGLLVLIAVLLVIWGATGIYRVQPDEQGIVLRFGKFVNKTSPGLHFHLPYPIETVEKPKVTRIN